MWNTFFQSYQCQINLYATGSAYAIDGKIWIPMCPRFSLIVSLREVGTWQMFGRLAQGLALLLSHVSFIVCHMGRVNCHDSVTALHYSKPRAGVCLAGRPRAQTFKRSSFYPQRYCDSDVAHEPSHFVSYLHHMRLVRHPYFCLFGSSVLCAFLSALNPLIQFPQQATPLQRGSVLMLWLRLLLRGVGHGSLP